MGFFGEEAGVSTIESIIDTTTLGSLGLIGVCNCSIGHPNRINADGRTTERGVASLGSKEMGFPINSPLFDDEGRILGTFREPLRPEQVDTMGAAKRE